MQSLTNDNKSPNYSTFNNPTAHFEQLTNEHMKKEAMRDLKSEIDITKNAASDTSYNITSQ